MPKIHISTLSLLSGAFPDGMAIAIWKITIDRSNRMFIFRYFHRRSVVSLSMSHAWVLLLPKGFMNRGSFAAAHNVQL